MLRENCEVLQGSSTITLKYSIEKTTFDSAGDYRVFIKNEHGVVVELETTIVVKREKVR